MQDIRVKAEWDGFAGLIERLDQLHNHQGDVGGRAGLSPVHTATISPPRSNVQSEFASQDIALKKTLSALEAELRAYARRRPKTTPPARRFAETHIARVSQVEMPASQAVDLEFVRLAQEFIQFAQAKEPGLKEEIELLRSELGEVASRLTKLCSVNSKPAASEETGIRLLENVEAIAGKIAELASAKSVNSFTKRLSAIETQLNLLANAISRIPSPLHAEISRDLAIAVEELEAKLDAKLPTSAAAAQDLSDLKFAMLEKLALLEAGQDKRFTQFEEGTEKLQTKLDELSQGLIEAGTLVRQREQDVQIAKDLEEALSRLSSRQETETGRLRESLGFIETEIQKAVTKIAWLESQLQHPAAARAEAQAELPILALASSESNALPDIFNGAALGLIEPGHGCPEHLLEAQKTEDADDDSGDGNQERLARLPNARLPLADLNEGLSREDFIAAARRATQAAPYSGQPLALTGAYRNGTLGQEKLGLTLILRLKRLMQRIKKPSGLTLLALLILGTAYNRLEDTDAVKSLGQAQSDPQQAQVLEPSRSKPDETATLPQTAEAGPKLPARPLAADLFDPAIHGPSFPGETQGSPIVSPKPMPGAERIAAAALQPSSQTLVLSTRQDGGDAGLSRDFLELKAQAEAGNSAAQYVIAQRYALGQGVARDFKQALDYFGRSAGQGLAPAQFRLASIYEKGLGTEKNVQTAASWYQRAAETGNVHAMHNLGVLLAEGLDGRPDYARAAFWFAQAAAYGEGDSQFNLAVLLGRGLGVTQDLGKSYGWFAIAAALGDGEAAKKRDETGARLSMSEIQTAKKFAQTYTVRPRDRLANEVEVPLGGFKSSIPVVAKNADL